MTSALPTGTVTFLLTDIEDSSRLWEHHPTSMGLALSRHDELIEHLSRPEVRLLTLSGPAGIGKTRVALQAAAEAADTLEGVFFVALASIADTRLVLPTIAKALSVREASRQPLFKRLTRHGHPSASWRCTPPGRSRRRPRGGASC